MTVLTTLSKVRQDGDGISTSFPFTFKVFSDDDLKVIEIVKATGAESVVSSADYTVSLNTGGEGGSVVFDTAPANTVEILVKRELDVTQEIDFPRGSNFPEESVENGYDKAIMLIQEITEVLSRAILFSEGSELSSLDFPVPVANKALLWDATGEGLTNSADDFNDIVTNAETAQGAAETAQSAAEGAQTSAESARDLAEDWASETSSDVNSTGEYSAKEYAQGTQTRGAANGGSAKDWANYVDGSSTVDDTEYSAKYWAQQAASVAGPTVPATETISGSGTITHDTNWKQVRRVVGDGAVTTDAAPFGTTAAGFLDGSEIDLIGTSDTNTVTIPSGTFAGTTAYQAVLKGPATLKKGDVLTVIIDKSQERVIEKSRNF